MDFSLSPVHCHLFLSEVAMISEILSWGILFFYTAGATLAAIAILYTSREFREKYIPGDKEMAPLVLLWPLWFPFVAPILLCWFLKTLVKTVISIRFTLFGRIIREFWRKHA